MNPTSPPVAGGTTQAQSAAMANAQALQTNQAIRDAILSVAQEQKQTIYTNTFDPRNGNNVIQVPFKNVGLVKGFIVKVQATFSQIGVGDAITLTPWNAANLLSNATLYDLDNYQRINTTGVHLNKVASSKEGFMHGAAILNASTDYPVKYGNNFNAVSCSAPTSGATGSAIFYYWVPCAYSATDLRGAIYAGVVNATAYLNLTVNPTPFVATGSDSLFAIFTGTAATPPTISSVTINVIQCYLDQLPRFTSGPNVGAPILPPVDIATQYRLNNTSLTGVTPNQDFPIPFSNFQQFLSLGIEYDQKGTLNGGTDLNYMALAAANTYQLFKLDPVTIAWLNRHKLMTDFPVGSYLFDFRKQPIITNQTGNMQLLLNAITAAAGTQVQAEFEAFALINTVLGAASLPAS